MKEFEGAKDYLKKPYGRTIIPDEGGGFYAEMLEFPGCYADGATPSEAFENLEKAAESWIEASLEHGYGIPPPSDSVGLSKKVVLRIPKSLHRKATRIAERNGLGLDQFLLTAIATRLDADDVYEELPTKAYGRTATEIMTREAQRKCPPSPTSPAPALTFPTTHGTPAEEIWRRYPS